MTSILQYRLQLLSLVFCAAASAPATDAAQATPALMQVPAGNYVVWRTAATGRVHYACTVTPDGPAWRIASSQATLTGTPDTPDGSYSSPPATWRASDGSSLTGMQTLTVSSGHERLDDQLIIANPSQGAGILLRVTYIQRLVSAGGGAPALPCSHGQLGQTADRPFQAEYVFWAPN